MNRWTIAEPSDGRYRLHINHGGTSYWCMFDFAVLPAPECSGVEFALGAEADSESAEWFPHLRQGMLRGLQRAREYGREWVGLRIEVRKVHTHPIDTTASGCERYGFTFVLDELPNRGLQLPEQKNAEPSDTVDGGACCLATVSEMQLPLASLKNDVERRMSLWERQVVTATETVGWLLDRFAFAVQDIPDAQPAISEALALVPASLLTGMTERLAGCRLMDGRWHWPPAGPGLPNPGPPGPWGVAEPAEAEALEVLAGWLRNRAGSR